jgi:hypothetical protein
MAAFAQATNERRHGISEAEALDAKLYQMGWMLGIAVGALTIIYRCAG